MALSTALLLVVLPGRLFWIAALVVLWPRWQLWSYWCRGCRRVVCWLVGHRRHRDSPHLRPDLGGMGENAHGHTYSWTLCSRCRRCTLWWSPRYPDVDEVPPAVIEVRARKLPPAMPLPKPGPGRTPCR